MITRAIPIVWINEISLRMQYLIGNRVDVKTQFFKTFTYEPLTFCSVTHSNHLYFLRSLQISLVSVEATALEQGSTRDLKAYLKAYVKHE